MSSSALLGLILVWHTGVGKGIGNGSGKYCLLNCIQNNVWGIYMTLLWAIKHIASGKTCYLRYWEIHFFCAQQYENVNDLSWSFSRILLHFCKTAAGFHSASLQGFWSHTATLSPCLYCDMLHYARLHTWVTQYKCPRRLDPCVIRFISGEVSRVLNLAPGSQCYTISSMQSWIQVHFYVSHLWEAKQKT